jgi:hypothetical protein
VPHAVLVFALVLIAVRKNSLSLAVPGTRIGVTLAFVGLLCVCVLKDGGGVWVSEGKILMCALL